jgi:hypothetical protein
MAEHITIGDTAPRIQYLASGTDTAFTYPFPIFRAADMVVDIDGATVTEGFSVTGAGRSEGGSVIFEVPPRAGAVVTLRRSLTLGRVTDFQENGELRAAVLNDELDFQAAALQQVADEAGRALRFAPSDTAPEPVLPPREARANRLVGFDSAGALALYPATGGEISGTVQQLGAGAVLRPIGEKLGETLSARDFGAVGDGATDDRAALEAAFAAAALGGRVVVIPEGDYLVSGPVSLPAAAGGLSMRGRIVYGGSAAATVLTLGGGAAGAVQGRVWQGIRVVRTAQSGWTSEDDIGVLIRTPNDCSVEVAEAAGFTIGVRLLSEGATASGTTLTLGRIANNRIGLDLRSGNSAGGISGLRVLGGRFAIAGSVNPAIERYGVRISAAAGANRVPTGLVFDAPFFSLAGGSAAGIPFLVETDGRALAARDIRIAGTGAVVARHTGAAEDHLYDVAAATDIGPLAVEFATGAGGRAGAVVTARQAGTPSLALSRPVATVASLRAAAYRWSATQTGFDQLACIDGTAPPPATLAEAARPGLDGYTLGTRGVTLGAGRGLGFAVGTAACRHFALSVDGDPVRLVVFCFNAAGALMTDAAGVLVRLSTGAITFDPARGWWGSASELSEAARTSLPAIWISPLVSAALIGVVRGAANAELRALRLTADPRHVPALLSGLPDLPHGRRELVAETTWDPPSLAANATATLAVAVPGAAVGDHVTAGFSVASANVLFLGTVTAADSVTAVAWNRSATTTDLPLGTLRLRVIKT